MGPGSWGLEGPEQEPGSARTHNEYSCLEAKKLFTAKGAPKRRYLERAKETFHTRGCFQEARRDMTRVSSSVCRPSGKA